MKSPRLRNGVDGASADLSLISSWWKRWPEANVGIACAASGLLVIDIDGPEACRQWEALQRRHGPVGSPLIAATGRGWHFIYQNPGGPVIGKLADGIDVKSNGYIVAAPSMHASGQPYRWYEEGDPSPAPDWLVRLLLPPTPPQGLTMPLPPATADRALAGAARRLASMPPNSGRNNMLNWAAFQFGRRVALGLVTEQEVVRVLLEAAAESGLPEAEALRTLTSGLTAGKAKGVCR